MPAFLTDRKWLTVLLAVFMAVALSACGGGGGGGTTQMPEPPPPPPTAEEMCTDAGNHWVDGDCLTPGENTVRMTLASIATAATAADAQAAYDAVKDQVTAAQGETLQAAVDSRIMAINMAARVDEQKQALMDAAGMIDTSDLSTQALVDAARTAIAGLRQAIADAVDIDDTSMYQTMLTNAVNAVDTAQGGIDTATRRTNQMMALSGASTTLQTALAALSGSTPTQAQLDAANNALTALNNAITAGADLTDTEKAPYQREADNAATPIETAQTAFDDAEDEAEKAANAAMAVTAAKLYKGIYPQAGAIGGPAAANDRNAFYNVANAANTADATTGVPANAAADTLIMVSIGGDTAPVPAALSEDKDTTLAALHGWTGKRYHRTKPTSEGTYEAHVYSHVGEPTAGDKFGQIGVTTAGTGYEYGLDANGLLTETDTEGTPSRIASPSFDHSAGLKSFELPTNREYVSISGTYHGVSGEYRCDPGDGGNVCAAQVAARGFTLGGLTDTDDLTTFAATTAAWTFKPANPEARVMSIPDGSYASYGWWLHTAANGDLTASAFVDRRGAAEGATGLTALNGTATYAGSAVGKYALSSTTGGTNDAGHFTAKATLEANFTNNTRETAITGTINDFIGADGESRDWSVKLNGSQIGDTGEIGNASASTGVDTVWTIGGTAADKSGNWTGSLQENGDDDGVPEIATGTFYTEYGSAGKMVGAFGANKQ